MDDNQNQPDGIGELGNAGPALPQAEAHPAAAVRGNHAASDFIATRDSYALVYRLALAALESPEAARRVAISVATAALRHGSQPGEPQQVWLLSRTIREIGRLSGQRKKLPENVQPVPEYAARFESGMQRLVDGWDTDERQLAALHYILGLPVSESATVLKVGAGAVQSQIELFRKRFAALPAGDSLETPETQWIPPPGAAPMLPVEQRAAAYLNQRWPAPALTDEDLEQLIAEIETQSAAQPTQLAPTDLRLWAFLAVAAVLAFASLTAAISWWTGRTGAVAPAVPGGPTAFPPTAQVKPLDHRSTTEEILERWQVSHGLWYSLTVDAQIVDYGPPSYIGPPRAYRLQGWVLQPNQGIELFGLLSEPAGVVYIAGGGRAFTRSYVTNRTASQALSGQVSELLAEGGLRGMVFPATSPWAQLRGSLWWAGRQAAAEAEAGEGAVVVFDWLNQLNQREARLWLDTQTGIILRQQVFGGEHYDRLQRESRMTEIVFGRREPPPGLIVAARQSQALGAITPGFQAVQPTPTPAMSITPPAPIPTDAAPDGMDPSTSRLIFQFASVPSASNLPVNTSDVPATLFADGYSLGEVRFGLPWVLRCDRSPDGKRLAFNTGSDGGSLPDEELRWFNLSRPGQIYRLMPGFNAAEFTFSPDGLSLAAAGVGKPGVTDNKYPPGIYLIKIATGDHHRLLDVDDAHSLVWGPDGEFMALIGRLPGQSEPAILVVHVQTGRVAYHGDPGRVDAPGPDSPIVQWGIVFPAAMGGMEDCAAP